MDDFKMNDDVPDQIATNFTLDVSIVVPVYGGSAALPELCSRLDAVMRRAGLDYEVILVDDRGQAEAWSAISAVAAQYPQLRGLRLGRNFGQHAATICGISYARGKWVVTMDDDLEHPPESVPTLLATGDDDHPLVYGVFEKRTHATYRNLSSELMRRMLKRAFPDLNEDYCSFRAIHAPLAKQLDRFGFNRPYIDGMLSWLTSSARSVSVPHEQRQHGESTYTIHKLLSRAANIFVTFSYLPLRIATFSGAGLASLSFLYLLYVIYGKLSGSIIDPGYASLMSVMLFACGIQLLILGVVGEYVGRLMGATFRRPVYVVDCDTRNQQPKP
ncbi:MULTISPECIES: glycosyltransferase family 2 protein [unclassified Rhodanobacter]|uniref:glycosyltransferase family 2 protein n=1 Tax=unclassified Rhodanobacter TaxID=2621553 RepID=UPI001BE0E23A|nr:MULTISPECIES: glycosyltransferase family 2 protein [unclassified Rhodanobacter]MBT2145630.1 glycosyltransferase family 2 protein [Rhodanobacter sp. LX-99]MBT2149675.1 glycosyltransferase family 2 protein [Rhodanobacter sp. LX-100]